VNQLQAMQDEKSVLRWGGLAGLLGGILFIVIFGVVAVFVGLDLTPEEMIRRYPDIRAARTVENSLYLLVLILWIAHFLTLHRALRNSSPAPALFGSVLGIAGLGVLAAGALPHVATAPISDLYHATEASLQDQRTLVLSWQATLGIFDALLFVGLVLLPISLVALGMAMFRSPAFGKRFGRFTVGLGVIGVIAATVVLIDPLSPMAAFGFFALITFNLVLGSKVYRLSRETAALTPAYDS